VLCSKSDAQGGKMKKTLNNITILNKDTGEKLVIATLDASLTPSDVIEKYIEAIEDGTASGGTLLRRKTQYEIDVMETLYDADIEDGETLILVPPLRGGGGLPIRNHRDIHFLNYIIEKRKDQIASYDSFDDFPSLYAVILYTNEDRALADYIHLHISELTEMSHMSENEEIYRNSVLFFVIEEPSKEWKVEIEKDLGAMAGMYFDAVWERLEGAIYSPYDKSKAYEIALKFGVKPKQLPCVIFFTKLGSYQTLVVEINEFIKSETPTDYEYARFFRTLFFFFFKAIEKGDNLALKELSKIMKKEAGTKISSVQLLDLSKSIIELIAGLLQVFKSSQ